MEKFLSGRRSVLNTRPRSLRAAGMSFLLAMVMSGTALGQDQRVTGTVTTPFGGPERGVTVRVQGTEIRTVTDEAGRYSIAAPSNATLTFSKLGQKAAQSGVGGRATVNVTMEPISYLEEVLVTAYTEQRRADITGAVASVNLESVGRQTSASVLQRLDGNVTGVTVVAGGSPGSRSTVRIRGISSFQNNDPLYVIDGTPVSDSYVNFLNPNDIESIQVLKDASSASIYGSRAGNGVILIETTKRAAGGPPRATFRARTGVATPVRGYDDFLILNALDYFQVVKQSYLNAGLPVPTNIYGDPNNPTIPQYTYAPDALITAKDQWDRPITVNEAAYSFPNNLIMPGSVGTNWWEAVFGPARIGDYNLDVSGGSDDTAYGVSFNYFDQEGTAAYNHFRRGSVRVNTSFNRGRLSFGENISLSVERANGGLPDDPGGYAEDGILGKNILMQPVVPLRDIQGNFASGKGIGLGNQSNPLKFAFGRKDNERKDHRIFGNVFASFAATAQLALKTALGFNVGEGSFTGFNPIVPENSEPSFSNSINENSNNFTDWTLSNTLRYDRKGSRHNLALLLGQAAGSNNNRFITAGMSNLISTDVNSRYLQDALGEAASKNVTSTGGKSSILSFFGKADYNFADKYVASFTLRQDGSSNLGPSNRWGTFPAFGLGWRLSNEPFMEGNRVFSDVMLRFGWGITGNQSIPAGRIVSQFGGSRGDTYYDVTGSNSSIVAGFRQTSLGNPDLKWEENESVNVGADVALFDGALNLVVDVYRRETNNLLFGPPIPATAGIAAPPIVNIGSMRNTGFDVSVGHRARSWSVNFNGSKYKNEIVSIDGVQDFFYGPIETRFGNQVINQVGHPIGSFYGLVADGLFKDAADVAAHVTQDGKAPGRIKFRDINGDGQITLADRTIIGSPHPDWTAGLDLGLRRGNWDLSGTFFGSFGNDIFDVQKEFYVFRNFDTNVRSDLLENSWTPERTDAKYPRLDRNDSRSSALSSFYVEDGSYIRLRNLQLGYEVPQSLARWVSAARIYVQAENLFTITDYEGLDPSLPAANVFGPAGDIRDQYRGVDRGTYPSSRTFSVGMSTTF
ncbi:MAG: SusC/RagA family TonB-linked outer membrane protein [Gemmatimonadota bacterium]|nr:SusC/RagA family TonB-linked outer membrane protein [Gemmatimonadota bacterium]